MSAIGPHASMPLLAFLCWSSLKVQLRENHGGEVPFGVPVATAKRLKQEPLARPGPRVAKAVSCFVGGVHVKWHDYRTQWC
jgi:hypothetical protein